MNLKLYEIEKSYLDITQSIIDADGEINEFQELALQLTQENLETKSRGYGYIVRDLETDCDIIDKEIERLRKFKSARVKTIEKLSERLSEAMILFGVEKIESPTIKISFRKSESVEVDDVLISEKYCKVKTTITPDKVLIKEELKKGTIILGATLKQNLNLQIK